MTIKDDKNHKRPVSDEAILKIAKEITVKFIEIGKITPSSFDIAFTNIFTTIEKIVRKG